MLAGAIQVRASKGYYMGKGCYSVGSRGRDSNSLVAAIGVLACAALACALGVQVSSLGGHALVDVEALGLAIIAHVRDESGAAHALKAAEGVLALGLAVLPACKTISGLVRGNPSFQPYSVPECSGQPAGSLKGYSIATALL